MAGPPSAVAKDQLPDLVGEFTAGVRKRMETAFDAPDLIHANYWLSGVAGHELKHDLNLPLVSTFHTLARVKAETCGDEPEQRARAEAQVIGCSDAILASTGEERAQLERLYDAPADRIELVSPGVLHAYFSAGDRFGARRALHLDLEERPEGLAAPVLAGEGAQGVRRQPRAEPPRGGAQQVRDRRRPQRRSPTRWTRRC